MAYLRGMDVRVEITPADGPPIEVPTKSVYLTDVGNRVAFIEYVHDTEMTGRLKRGQAVRLVVDEGERGERHEIERATLAVMSRDCQACHAVQGVFVVAELKD